jgi:Family of unknown function (DUF6502)
MSISSTPPDVSEANAEQLALLAALTKLFAPLAQLCVGSGLSIQTVEEALRRAYVSAGLAAHQSAAGKITPASQNERLTSRISASTGLTRREVNRLLQLRHDNPAHKPSAASEVFTKWVSEPSLRDEQGLPKGLAKQGQALSFESLAQSVTTDLHPRAILEELLRLNLVYMDEQDQQLKLRQQAFVPRGDKVSMAHFFGENLGDHMKAACENMLSDGRQHLEQAVFADELSDHSVEQVKALLTDIWKDMLARLSQEFTRLIEEDRQHQRVQDKRMRVGLYSLQQPMAHPD